MPSMAAVAAIGARSSAVTVLQFSATGVSILDVSLQSVGLDLTLLVASASLKSPTQFSGSTACDPHIDHSFCCWWQLLRLELTLLWPLPRSRFMRIMRLWSAFTNW